MKTLLLLIHSTFSTYSYRLFNEPVSFDQAANACRIYPTATLARITSRESRQEINKLLQKSENKQFWIEAFGLWKRQQNTWINIEDNIEMQGCGSFSGQNFKVEQCRKKLPYICQMWEGTDSGENFKEIQVNRIVSEKVEPI